MLTTLATLLTTLACCPQSPVGQPGRVLVIGLDGVRSDALRLANTPNMDSLVQTGTVSWTAYAGGEYSASDPTHQVTSSGPGWSSILTGVWTNLHGVADNSFSGNNFANYPHFFGRVRASNPTADLASIVHWGPINDELLTPFPGLATYTATHGSDAAVAADAANYLTNNDPDALVVHLDDGDHEGHANGFSPGSASYLATLAGLDIHVGTILTALQARPSFQSENWLVLMTSDHGGANTSHGGHSPNEREVWIIASGGNVGHTLIDPGPGHASIAPTALEHMGIAISTAWGLDPSFALPQSQPYAPQPRDEEPHARITPALSWAPAVDAQSYDVFVGTTATLTNADLIGTTTQLQWSPVRLPASTTHYWRIDANTTSGTQPSPTWQFTTAGSLSDDLALHVDFQSRVNDVSLHVSPPATGGPLNYVAGQEGAALSLPSSSDYVSYGAASALQFGSQTDFSIALWMRSDGFTGDPVFIGNKDWGSGGYTGWVIAGDVGGTWQWNYRGASGSRRDYDRAGRIDDGQWHLITITHDRDGSVRFYHDGNALTAGELASPGSIDALATVVGQDGTLSYGHGAAAEFDELRIWRRVLGAHEVRQLWAGGPNERWRQLPGGSVGAAGIPELDGAGPLTGGTTTSLILNTHGTATIAAIGFGAAPANLPLVGTVLVPLPVASITLITDTTGHSSVSFPWPYGVPQGQQNWMQAWVLDPTSPTGLTTSNGLLLTSQ